MMTRIRSVKPALFRHAGLFEAEQEYQFLCGLVSLVYLCVVLEKVDFVGDPVN